MTREILAEYERTKAHRDSCRSLGDACPFDCATPYRVARRRLVLSALAYVVAAVTIVGVVYVLILLGAAAYGPAPIPTNYQLPTI